MTAQIARFSGIDALLDDARSRLDRFTPSQAAEAVRHGALLVDIRPHAQRVAEGEIPGSHIVERNHLEWRLDPNSDARIEAATGGQHWIVFCSEGYTSSLAADALNSIGVPSTDMIGGFVAWRGLGLATIPRPMP